MKFRKKPVVVEAELYQEGMEDGWGCYSIMGGFLGFYEKDAPLPRAVRNPAIKTLEGWHEVSKGDWIITGIKGERYPIKPDIFEMTYVPVDKVSEIPLEECQERVASELDKLLWNDKDLTQEEKELQSKLRYWLFAQLEILSQYELGVR